MQKIIVKKENIGKRADKFLKEEVFFSGGITRGEIVEKIKAVKILINNKQIKPSYLLKEKDEIMLGFNLEKKERLRKNSDLKIPIVYQNENFIVINKPANIQVHPDFHEKEKTLVNFLLVDFPEIENVHDESVGAEMRPGIVHRLDKETSGIMLVARNQKTFLELKRKFQNKEIAKKYQAIVYGVPNPSEGIIEKPLARSADYRKQVIAGRKTKTIIREAVTKYRTVKEVSSNYALLELEPKTGRMHQLRVHLTSIGYPIVGDKKYYLRGLLRRNEIERQLLHAKNIKFELFGKGYEFEAPLPEDFEKCIKGIEIE
ncbi:MAG: RluA family pseudouridine synthase [Candidatus Moraniibacteriota bacterium]